MMIKKIVDRQFRANPAYTLVAYNRLSPYEREQLEQLAEDANFYGVMVNGGDSKAVDPETALLILTLQEPGYIPSYIRHKFGRTTNQAIARLVLDDVLQIAVGDDFLSGPKAHAAIYETAENQATSNHPIAQLSHKALRYAQAMPLMPHDLLAQRLYLYNTIPISAYWRQKLPSATTVEAWLGINSWMEPTWQRTDNGGSQGWISWHHRRSNRGSLAYKLYISPHPDIFAQVFAQIVEILGRHQVPSFKVGKDVSGILRPDKMVAYLPNLEELAALAQVLQAELAGCAPQGVPFTAPIDNAGLLSWGMDPPDSAQVFAEDGRNSWRFWITQQLATTLNLAKASDTAVEPWQFALDRLQLEGVDTKRWVPRQTIWNTQD
ncbi:MAG: hypothetical protein R6X34_09170 [Chloroflexota bacterium]|jgi:hypothetical protein